jgi:uncharacterized protein YecT (DUF1311 family)
MKYLTTIFFSFFYILIAKGQTDFLADFKSHKFPCDSESTTLEINFCSGVRRDYADSLLNVAYNRIIKSLEKEIFVDQNKLKDEKLKRDSSSESKETIEFLSTEISYNKRLKESIIKSQRKWVELRDLNMEVVSITCEGGTAFVAIENQSIIEDTLDRIKKLEDFYDVE